MSNFDTAALGIQAAMDMIEKRGGRNINLHKEGHKKFITFVSIKGKQMNTQASYPYHYKSVPLCKRFLCYQQRYKEHRLEKPDQIDGFHMLTVKLHKVI